MKFGDKVTNIAAGSGNPQLHTYYVKRLIGLIEVTDKKGRFWKISDEIVFPGHLDESECKRLFAPIWEARFGNNEKP